jgi:hypothetical protein
VYACTGSRPETALDVVMSEALFEGDYMAKELQGRTFSFASVDYDPTDGPLHLRVVKRFGGIASKVEIQPRRAGIHPEVVKGREAKWDLTSASQYLSVAFLERANETAPHRWIKHMLCVFVNPVESEKPEKNGPSTAVYSQAVPATELSGAKVIYFPAGHHDLRSYRGAVGPISDGVLKLHSGQSVYLESGAFVDGLIWTEDPLKDADQRLYGRGILSGRKFPWYNKPGYRGPRYQDIVHLGNRSSVEGITIMESPAHGVVAGNRTQMRDVKLLGWHCNNDGVRVGAGSEVERCFIRAVDDHFYNFNIRVRDCVLWAGHNGAVLTYGWGGTAQERVYHSGASTMERIDIIHPEWVALGNNNGLVASQTGLDYRPHGYGGETLTTLRDVRIDGGIPGLLNLKPRSEGQGMIVAEAVEAEKVGYLGDLRLENVLVDGPSGRALLKGKARAAKGVAPYFIQNVEIRSLTIDGVRVGEKNAARFFELDPGTTRDIRFSDGKE